MARVWSENREAFESVARGVATEKFYVASDAYNDGSIRNLTAKGWRELLTKQQKLDLWTLQKVCPPRLIYCKQGVYPGGWPQELRAGNYIAVFRYDGNEGSHITQFLLYTALTEEEEPFMQMRLEPWTDNGCHLLSKLTNHWYLYSNED